MRYFSTVSSSWLCLLLWIEFGHCRADSPNWNALLRHPDSWCGDAECTAVIRAVLSHQSPRGDWPKGADTTLKPYEGDSARILGTFDNGATTNETRFLAHVASVTNSEDCKRAVIRSIDHILEAQYPTGGWPQRCPAGRGYHRHITFNDDVMVNLMGLLREVGGSGEFAFVDEARRRQARGAFDHGVACILKCQIVVDGKKTAWCAQHDEISFAPRRGRTFEPVSLSGSESAGILLLLMSLERPSPEIVDAVKSGVDWLNRAKLSGIRQATRDGDKVIVSDPTAPALWARFYEIGTNRPIFCSRDGIVHFRLSEISSERRNGYSWYVDRPGTVLARYPLWLKGCRVSDEVHQ